jgi:outer membrane protein assembly factor BamB
VVHEILVVPTGTTITAIDMRTGAMLWQAQQLGHLAAADGTIVGQRGTGKPGDWTMVTALDAASGQERWTVGQTLPQSGDLVAGDGVIVFMDQINTQNSSEPVLIAYELSSGAKRWHVPLPRDRYLAPQRISGTLLVQQGDRELAILSTTDGATIWSAKEPFKSPKGIQPQMISFGSNGAAVFVASNSVPASCAPRCD